METLNTKSKKLRKSRQKHGTITVSYEVSDVSPEKRERMVEAAFNILFEATLKRMSTTVSK